MGGNSEEQLAQQKEEFLKQLRMRTAPQHEALEENKFSKAIGDGSITKEGLSFFLGKFYSFFSPLEEVIYQTDAVPVQDVMQRKKTHLIKKDLEFLKTGNTSAFWLATNASALPEYKTEAQKMGIMYVMEGATLGGKVIGRMLKKSLGIDENCGCSYYNCYGENLGPLWKQFVSDLTTYAVTTGKESEIIEAASQTFSLFKNWLEKEHL